jgi:hypothetical protein
MTSLMRVRTVFDYGQGGPGLMTHYFQRGGAEPTNTDAQNAANRVRDMLLTAPNLFPTNFQWTVQGNVDVLDDSNGEVSTTLVADPTTGAGTNTSGLGPLAIGLLLKNSTDTFIQGRRLVGRTYLVPIARNLIDGSLPSSATRAAVVTLGDALRANGTTFVAPFVWSRPRPATAVGPHRPAGAARAFRAGSSAAMVSSSCPAEWVVLRSRRD